MSSICSLAESVRAWARRRPSLQSMWHRRAQWCQLPISLHSGSDNLSASGHRHPLRRGPPQPAPALTPHLGCFFPTFLQMPTVFSLLNGFGAESFWKWCRKVVPRFLKSPSVIPGCIQAWEPTFYFTEPVALLFSHCLMEEEAWCGC